MEQKHLDAIKKIVQFTKQNKEFGEALRKELEIALSANYSLSAENNDIKLIREVLDVRANPSITYSFVNDERTRDQLIIDNLRMENAALKTDYSDETRFYLFCVNAFYQIENIINYYIYKKEPLFEDSWIFIRDNSDRNFTYNLKESDENLSQIPIAYKINAVCNYLLPNDKFKLTLNNLRKARNEGEHRCAVIFTNKNEKESLYNLYKYNTINDIRSHVRKLVSAIETDLNI